MKKLKFYYGTMNAGKSTLLLQQHYNNSKKHILTFILVPATGNKMGMINSRIGLKKKAKKILNNTNIFTYIGSLKKKPKEILIDEAQFLTKKHIFELISIVDILKINVSAYGLRTDFRSKLFDSSKYLLTLADEIIEIKTTCKCGKKAIMNAKIIHNQKIIHGNQINIDKNIYRPLCRYHFFNFKKKYK
ncbi:MAG: thymidine kinase [Candidatus Riesia sp.]|nr:thymidine kinase [Candidatus Riesia sp.]